MKITNKTWGWLLATGSLVSAAPNAREAMRGSLAARQTNASTPTNSSSGPIFAPPVGNAGDLLCDYSAMGPEWRSCSTPDNRGCWLTNGTFEYNINTEYEKWMPTGTVRKYTLDVVDGTLNVDGHSMPYAQLFNGTFPGPWLRACWGDTLEITVKNNLKFNGTTIHWHGMRHLDNTEVDGVNAVSQCPIAGYPMNDSYTYRITAGEYGTSWYHSHYSLQYTNGMYGPMTFYGPASANYDEAKLPMLIGDTLHSSAYANFYKEVTPGLGPPAMDNLIINGIGVYNCTEDEKSAGVCEDRNHRFNTTVTRGKKYMLSLINTSTESTLVFSIDNHNLTVMSTDYVPIHPYTTNSILIGIGQRYHVVVEANPVNETTEKNFWIRTVPADGCFNFGTDSEGNPIMPANTTGILFYDDGDQESLPTTAPTYGSTECADEPYENLVPIIPWTVGHPSNEQENSTFQVSLLDAPAKTTIPPAGDFARWAMDFNSGSMWLNFSDPTIQHLNQGVESWPKQYAVAPELTDYNGVPNYERWIFLLITSTGFPFGVPDNRNFVPVAHPIHLHGHDFALVAQQKGPYWAGFAHYNLDNPPRRDVALLPSGGFIILAFKADNPGAWAIHCHIAWHASNGLAVQILERDGGIKLHNPNETARVCNNYRSWIGDKENWFNPSLSTYQDDSGV